MNLNGLLMDIKRAAIHVNWDRYSRENDHALDLACTLIEKTGGSLYPVWQGDCVFHWNRIMSALRGNSVDIDKQLLDRASTITSPGSMLAASATIIHRGVSWRVLDVGNGVLIERHGMRETLFDQEVESFRVVLRSRKP